MNRYEKIIFVSMNNTIRGPMAELLMKKITKHKDLEIISRGLVVLFQEPFNPKAVAVLRNRGIILDNRTSMQLKPEELTEDALILTIGKKEKELILEEYEPKNVYTLIEFAGDTGEITDPYGKEIESYKICAEELEYWLLKVEEKLSQIEEEEEENDSDSM